MKQRGRNRGFSLIEVLIAAAILAISGLALAASLAQGPELSLSPREEIAARNAVRSILAEIAATPYHDVAPNHHNRNFAVLPLRAVPGDPDGLPGEVRLSYGPGDDQSFYTVVVRVRWDGQHGRRLIESVSYLANVRGDTGTVIPLEELSSSTPPPE